ncbi:Signal transduction histidine kinase [Geodermatophilus amargosae]|uniref:histidine kinase n=1 Tax=Geodermatophilus amargosae TaxID=1296565 RepID=A0A1I6ZGF2_9ACTN|nr:ATP-binding protein [Geodermatophilus amargosae]SFT61796.1 Signal transduction histidine kinase [Geodermatophilus amargosae]
MAPDPVAGTGLQDVAPGPGTEDVFAGGSGNGRLMAAFDWSTTPIGPVETWPASLRYAVRTVLASRFPMILTWGREYTQFYNDAYAELIGAKHPGAIGDDLRITLAEGWAALQQPVEHAMATREASWIPQLLLLLERAGYREETYFTVSHAPAFGDDGEVAGMHAVCTEVTRQVVAERRQRLLHEVSTAAGRREDERDLAAQVCGALAGDLLDVPFAAVYLTGDGARLHQVATVGVDAAALPATAERAAELGDVDVVALHVPGGPFGDEVGEAVALPLSGGAGREPVGALLVGVSPNRALDEEYRTFHQLLAGQVAAAVTDARAYAAERARAEALAELDQAKTTFFSDVSHELRTPLTLLLGPITDALAESGGQLPAPVREQLTLALRNGQRLKRLVDDLLEFVSIEAGRTAAVRVATDLAVTTAELAGVLRAAAERAGLTLTVDCPPLPRPAAVDPRMWEKIVLNLVANAVKYTFVGSIAVSLRADGDEVVLRVSDTGVGIPAAELPALFERFHRVADSPARSREGTGLGLAMVRELVGLHGGTVSVESEPGTGSTFTVRVPFGEPDTDTAPPASPAEVRGAALTPWDDDLAWQGRSADPLGTVLVVDDNADMRAYLTRLLSPSWTVRTASDGEQALHDVARVCPDVVLTDVMMPGLDGFGLLRALRADPATQAVPVVMLTARAGQEAAVEGFDAGVDDYLPKPFESAELLGRLRAVFERSRGRREPVLPAALPAAASAAPAPPPRPRAAGSVTAGTVTATAAPPQAPVGRPDSTTTWRFPSRASSIPALRRRLRALLDGAGLDGDRVYDLVLAACEAATNAVEHAQDPGEPVVDVRVTLDDGAVEIAVRDHGQWKERTSSMDRGRGSMLMSAFAEITAVPGPAGTTVTIRSPRPAA